MKKIFLLALFLVFATVPARAGELIHWDTLKTESKVTFSQNGGPTLPVLSYKVEAVFDAAALETSEVTLYLDLTHAFFEPEMYLENDLSRKINMTAPLGEVRTAGPGTGVFVTRSLEKRGDGLIVLTGEFGINGINQTVQIPLYITITSYYDLPKMYMKGSFAFNPQQFGGVGLDVPRGLDSVTIDLDLAMVPGA